MKVKRVQCFSAVLLISLMSGNLFSSQVFASETATSETATSETATSETATLETATSETATSEAATSNEISQKSYAEKKYENVQMNSEPTNDSNINKDTDNDGKLTYFKEVNGYVPKIDEIIEKNVPRGNGECIGDKITKSYTDEVDLNAKSVMDTNLDDYSNNGYLEKVKNPNNHSSTDSSNTDEDLYGPGNLEVQHWQNGPNDATKTQNWRVVFATDYAINNAVLTVTLPYDNVSVTNVTDWVINRYYPAVTNNNNIYTNYLVPLDISFNGNVATINFGNIVGYSAFGMIFSKTFDVPQDFSKDLKVTSARVIGTWKSDELNADSKYIKSSKTEPSIIWQNEVCPIPIDPETPETPETPEIPETPETPKTPETPETPSKMNVAENQTRITSLSNKVNNNLIEKNTVKATKSHNGDTLPKTGESKSTIFSVIGGIILLGFGSVTILRKKYSLK
ncbi:LPXTG cell wall anchor domain-containing protein [Enterococcus faecalis]|uniref:LPXTG cell wall anchor domain-containing protein n=1 Tax=Enterococcus faecalis TaxID=1351 RepID=UPI002DBFB40F|nr:LPXTG cell wall anchor domain-containing protein [Enterococcus faecalis]MEB6673818.1 LPXTG cell wall anchor domain-containing protein [Enterococcus faecalis]